MKFKNKKFLDVINEAMASDDKLVSVSFGQLAVVWGIIPLMVGVNYILLFGGITRPMACTIFIPSLAGSLFWYFCWSRRWFGKKKFI